MEAAGDLRRTGTRRTTRWHQVTDGERIAACAAELEARGRRLQPGRRARWLHCSPDQTPARTATVSCARHHPWRRAINSESEAGSQRTTHRALADSGSVMWEVAGHSDGYDDAIQDGGSGEGRPNDQGSIAAAPSGTNPARSVQRGASITTTTSQSPQNPSPPSEAHGSSRSGRFDAFS
jgi:hypothetical protein